jgi:hypothetical protein
MIQVQDSTVNLFEFVEPLLIIKLLATRILKIHSISKIKYNINAINSYLF